MKTMSKYEVKMLKEIEESCNFRLEVGDSWYDLAIYVDNIIYVQENYYSRSTEFIKKLQNMMKNFMEKSVE